MAVLYSSGKISDTSQSREILFSWDTIFGAFLNNNTDLKSTILSRVLTLFLQH